MHTNQRPQHRSPHLCAVLLAAAITLGGLLAPDIGLAQYPSRPIKLLVHVSAGGGPDVIARAVGERLSPLLGQPVVVENRPGANGNVAMALLAKSAPDGHTLGLCVDSMIVINPQLYAKMPVDTLRDIQPIAAVSGSPTFFLAVHPSLPVKTFREFIEYAKAAKPPLAYASGGNGSQHHMAMEMLKLRAGIELVHVPYKGGTPAATAAMAGQVSALFAGTAIVGPMRAGRLRGLALTGRDRLPLFADLPTIGEVYPGYHMSTWNGIFAPDGVPEPAILRLRAGVSRVLAMPEVKARLNAAGFEIYIATPEEFSARIRADHEKYGQLVKRVGVKID